MKIYKLTTQEMTTYKGFRWEIGKKVTASGRGTLCTKGWLHFYRDKYFAIIFNPLHADIINPRMWEAEAGGEYMDDSIIKSGCTELTLLREIKVPEISLTQKVALAVLCAKEVYHFPYFTQWADAWLSGEDRSKNSAFAVKHRLRVQHKGIYNLPNIAAFDAVSAAHANSSTSFGAVYATHANSSPHPSKRDIVDLQTAMAVQYTIYERPSDACFDLKSLIKKAMEIK